MTDQALPAGRALAAPGPAARLPGSAAVAAWALGAALVGLLGFSGGGYDAVLRGEVGIAAWWLVLAGAATGVLAWPRTRLAAGAVLLLAAFLAWTTLGLSWTSSAERTWVEVGRVAAYAGVFGLALAAAAMAPPQALVGGLATGIAAVGAGAVLFRVEPTWFDVPAIVETFPIAQRRLAYPLDYWNALAGLLAIGVPLLAGLACGARSLVVRALAAAAVPLVGLAIFFTISRGGLIAAALAAVVLVLLLPERPLKVPVLTVLGLGVLLVCAAADDRDAVQEGLRSAAALQEGEELEGLLLLVCTGCGLLAAAAGLVDRHVTLPGLLRPRRRVAGAGSAAVLAALVAAGLAAGGAGWLDDRFDEFRGEGAQPAAAAPGAADGQVPVPAGGEDAIERLGAVGGNGRWQFWQSARRAQETEPLHGIGPGTYELWYAKDGTYTSGGFIRDSHSIWMDVLAELGLVGVVLLGLLLGGGLVAGAVRALREPDPAHRTVLAAATAGFAAFLAIASVEWAWEMPVIALTGLALLAVLAGARPPARLLGPSAPAALPVPARAAVAVAALVALVLIAIPTAGESAVRESRADVRAGRLDAALQDARSATGVQPYSASARLQEALVLERGGRLRDAREAARAATAKEPTNWRTWLVLSRLASRTGDTATAVAAFRRARDLNPRSALFAR